jgi:hypothetical protein
MAFAPAVLPTASQELVAAGVVIPVATTQNVDGTAAPSMVGRNGDFLTSQVHGKYYASAARSNLYTVSGAGTTGVEILAPGGTTSGFCFGNLASSGVNMEVHSLRVVPIGVTVVVAALGLEYGVVPVSTTYQTGIVASPIGNGATPVCKVWDAVTITAMAWYRALPLFYDATTIINPNGLNEFFFDGALVISPGYAVNLVSTITQGTIKFLVDVTWSEWPV